MFTYQNGVDLRYFLIINKIIFNCVKLVFPKVLPSCYFHKGVWLITLFNFAFLSPSCYYLPTVKGLTSYFLQYYWSFLPLLQFSAHKTRPCLRKECDWHCTQNKNVHLLVRGQLWDSLMLKSFLPGFPHPSIFSPLKVPYVISLLTFSLDPILIQV